MSQSEIDQLKKELAEITNKYEQYKKFVVSWAWTGSNGSPYTEEQAKRLQSLIQNEAWELYKKVEGKTP